MGGEICGHSAHRGDIDDKGVGCRTGLAAAARCARSVDVPDVSEAALLRDERFYFDHSDKRLVIMPFRNCARLIYELLDGYQLEGHSTITDKSVLEMLVNQSTQRMYGFSVSTPINHKLERVVRSTPGLEAALDGLREGQGAALVNWVFVPESCRGRGYGKELLEGVLKYTGGDRLIGKIVDNSGRMVQMAMESGAVNLGGDKWAILR